MSKVYEALEQIFEGQQELEKGFPIKPACGTSVSSSTLPSLKMEREMVQLEQRLAHLLPDPHCNVVQFISCQSDEGVSSIAQEFARVVVEKQGKSVLLLDGDCKNIPQHHSLSIAPKMPLQQVLMNQEDLNQALTPVMQGRLFLARYSGGNSATLHHAGENKRAVWNQLRMQFDLMVVDAPPLAESDEGLELSQTVDGVVLVVEAEKTRSHVIAHLKDQIVQNGGNFLGVVFNKQHHYIPNWLYRRL